LGAINDKLNQHGDILNTSKASNSALGSALQLFAGFAGVAIIGMVFSCIRGNKEDFKKFV
jgi:hypothetical protein